jgi:hypothetical protein
MDRIERIEAARQDARMQRIMSRRKSLGLLGGGAVAAIAGLAGCGGSGSSNTISGSGNFGPFTRATTISAFQNIMTDENTHVTYLTAAITANGGTPRPAPTFDTTQAVFNPTSVANFYALSDALENTGTGAYVYATQYLISVPTVLVAAASIGLVEGRHAGFLNILTGRPILTDPTPGANDLNSPIGTIFPTLSTSVPDAAQEVPQAPSTVAQRAAPFLVNVNLNGGPALPADNFSGQGAVPFAVLNYALLLEYLEKTFYDLNVPKFAV